jgi:hypothetical protein
MWEWPVKSLSRVEFIRRPEKTVEKYTNPVLKDRLPESVLLPDPK